MKITTLTSLIILASASAVSSFAQPVAVANQDRTASCNVVWTSPSHDATGSMPLGNGQVGINVWVEEDGDLRFYISRTDSLSEVSRLLKVGGVRISLEPNPFKAGRPFRQELRLSDGVCEITAGKGNGKVELEVFVDSDSPVIHVTGSSTSPVKVKAVADVWRTRPHTTADGEELNSSWTLAWIASAGHRIGRCVSGHSPGNRRVVSSQRVLARFCLHAQGAIARIDCR